MGSSVMFMSRPPFYETKEELQKAIDDYFQEIEIYNAKFAQPTNPYSYKHPTVTGMALYLGFSDRKSLIDYREKEEFSHTIKSARLRIEEYIEQRLYGNNVTGVIFNLKNNFNWRDSQDVNLGGQNGENPVKATIDVNFVKPKE